MNNSPTTSGKQDASSAITKLWEKHWIVAWFGVGLASYALIATISYWLMMHGFTIADHSGYDRATTVATIIQATLAAAGLLAVSAALLAIARNTDHTYKEQLDQQKWQRKEEFFKFAWRRPDCWPCLRLCLPSREILIIPTRSSSINRNGSERRSSFNLRSRKSRKGLSPSWNLSQCCCDK